MKVILSIKKIPLNSMVTKISGNKKYRVADTLSIFGMKIEGSECIKAPEGTRFIIGINDSNIACLQEDTEVTWYVTERELLEWVENEISEENMDHK